MRRPERGQTPFFFLFFNAYPFASGETQWRLASAEQAADLDEEKGV